ncbi:HAD-IIIC family phosphatase [Actinomadura yumaensis]|uniref:HAD-IIIC family phosphatase n=2 Tax=Actinomadura TaxID=1988 RepID=A0ABW2CGQ8_9ACTN
MASDSDKPPAWSYSSPNPPRLSTHTKIIQAADCALLTNVVTGRRIVVTNQVAEALKALGEDGAPRAAGGGAGRDGVDMPAVLALLASRGMLASEDDGALAERAVAGLAGAAEAPEPLAGPGPEGWTERPYWQSDPVGVDDFANGPPLSSLSMLIVGGCVGQFTAESLVRAGLRRRIDVQVTHRWPAGPGALEQDVAACDPDIVVLQFPGELYLSRLWDHGALVPHEVRKRRLEALKRSIAGRIGELDAVAAGRLALVHNLAPPAFSPFGRLDYREPVNFRQIVAEVNCHIDALAAGAESGRVMVVDEERLAVRAGAARLFDDTVFPFAHHGGMVDPEIGEVHQLPALGRALAEEYLACWEIHRGIGRVKCVAVDLDGTLWPGVLADDGPEWLDSDGTDRWMRLGLHQALRLLKERGILLSTCSKGDRDATTRAWEKLAHPLALRPEDFVTHQINWDAKSENLRTLCARLGLTPDQVLFLDDHPVERAEVRRNLPGVQILDAPVHEFRARLLAMPGCEPRAATTEARTRTETTRAMLDREDRAGAASPADFLTDLRVVLEVGAPPDRGLARIAELLSRTTQFTTTGLRADEQDLLAMVERGCRLYAGWVRDRFADYGLACACVLDGSTVSALAVSCRVIGLDVGPVFLAAALEAAGLVRRGTVGLLVETPRNTPARDVFVRAGFRPDGAGRFVLDDPDAVPRAGTTPHDVRAAGAGR